MFFLQKYGMLKLAVLKQKLHVSDLTDTCFSNNHLNVFFGGRGSFCSTHSL